MTSCKDIDKESIRELLLSNEPTEKNVKLLRKYLKDTASKVESIFTDDELKRYFTRRTFRGAVIRCNKMNYEEWIVLIGDSAHAVLPPVGEGINSGLEDAVVLS